MPSASRPRPATAPAGRSPAPAAPQEREGAGAWIRLTALVASAATLLAVVSGAAEWGTAHKLLSALALPPLAAIAIAAWLAYRRVLPLAAVPIALFGAAALLTAPGLHLAAAALAFASTLVLATAVHRGRPAPLGAWRDYVTLTKPRIMSLLLLTGAAGMFVGARGVPPLGDLAAAMGGLALACGGASALNHVLDADIDRLMGERTRRRPVTAGRITPAHALEFGLVLSAFSFVLLASLVNVLTAALALVGNLFYVLVYTRWLKRATVQNIVIGGAAGAVPPVVGYAAATGNLALPALFLFLIVFFWTPPHFWALALLIKRDYAAAGVPMLPVVRGERETVRQILAYSVLLIGVTIVPFAWGTLGAAYLGAAVALGAGFLWLAWRLARETTPRHASLLFHASLAYLALLFVAAAVDPLIA